LPSLTTRFRIVGWEVVGIAAFLLVLVLLQVNEAPGVGIVGSFAWVYAVVGVTLLLVGLETVALTRHIPK
jgi:hypothetical protein